MNPDPLWQLRAAQPLGAAGPMYQLQFGAATGLDPAPFSVCKLIRASWRRKIGAGLLRPPFSNDSNF